MPQVAATSALSEPQFAALVEELSFDVTRQERLIELLHEDHPVYNQRGAAATVRMRGWILLALARVELTDRALLFVLEELDTGRDPYLVAVAARALRSYAKPVAGFAPFVMRAIANIRYHDEHVTFERYGEYATSATNTTAVRELLATLIWLGPHARGVLFQIEALRADCGGLSKKFLIEVDRVLKSVADPSGLDVRNVDTCCCTLPTGLANTFSWALGFRRDCKTIEATIFEDQDGNTITFGEFFRGHPSVVVFFYTRCDNPQKCSLTITKLARLQNLLRERGLAQRIRTAAVTYDPAFDVPERLRRYGISRGVYMDADHRMLRATDGVSALRSHFKLGVNFVESLVNRHRIEVYVLDAAGRIAASFERIHWEEQQVVDRAVELLAEERRATMAQSATEPANPPARPSIVSPMFGTLVSLGVAFFPKCPVCWAAYLSVFGIAGLQQIPYSPWLQPILVALMLLNLFGVWMRGRATRRMSGFSFVAGGAIAIVVSKTGLGLEHARAWGVALTLVGSLLSALSCEKAGPVLFLRRLGTRA
jgi:protein SCO1/2